MDKKKLVQRKIELFVGSFVVLGIFALIILTFKVSSNNLNLGSSTYNLFARFDNIGSLSVRAPVKIGGVIIGRVDKIFLEKETMLPVVSMQISDEYKNLSDNTSASILTAGLLGEQFLGLTPGFYLEDESSYLSNGDFINLTNPAIVLEDLIGQFLYSTKDGD